MLNKLTNPVSYVELKSLCNPITSTSCTSIPMTNFTDFLGYQPGDLLKATVAAWNVKGWSDESDPNTVGALAMSFPLQAPSNITIASLSTSSVQISWNNLTTSSSIGYSTLTMYVILWDQGSNGDFIIKQLNAQSPVTITGLNAGDTYRFKVYAWNAFGNGPSSNPVSINVGIAPSKMNPV